MLKFSVKAVVSIVGELPEDKFTTDINVRVGSMINPMEWEFDRPLKLTSLEISKRINKFVREEIYPDL